jgi:hypothetical protein
MARTERAREREPRTGRAPQEAGGAPRVRAAIAGGRAALTGSAAFVAADGIGLNHGQSAAVGGVAAAGTLVVDTAVSLANRRALRRQRSAPEIAFRKGIIEFLTMLQTSIEEQSDPAGWPEPKQQLIDGKLDEAIQRADDYRDDKLAAALQRVKDRLDLLLVFGSRQSPADLTQQLAAAISAAQVPRSRAVVVRERGFVKRWLRIGK